MSGGNVYKFGCLCQAKLFEYVAKRGYDLRAFSESYMRSDFVRREIDSLWSYYQTQPPIAIVEILTLDYPEVRFEKLSRTVPHLEDFAHWMGYMYSYYHQRFGTPSADIVNSFPYEIMRGYYPAFTTMSWEAGAESMREDATG